MSKDIQVTVSRDGAGNVLVVLNDLDGNTLAGATFPPEYWYHLRGALMAVEEQMLQRGWIQPHEYDLQPLPVAGGPGWN
jgi:hypothetical protein